MSTPSLLGPEWDTGGWMYLALDLGATHVIKVGYTTDPRHRGKSHRRWGLTTVCQWAVSSELVEADWHHDMRRYRRRAGDQDTATRVELYDPHLPVVNSIMAEILRAEGAQSILFAKGWNGDRVYRELDDRAMAFRMDEDWA